MILHLFSYSEIADICVMNLPFFYIEAFTQTAGKGNPAGVYLLPSALEEAEMQSIAMERNLPETGFVQRRPDGFSLRWFTPATELNLCGHGTLAAAHVLWEQGWLEPGIAARFHTCAGELMVRLLDDGWIEMDFPAFPLELSSLPAQVAETLTPLEVWKTRDRLMVVLGSEAEVREYRPDFERLRDIELLITAASDKGAPYDFVSRTFVVPFGVNEDFVTGSAHCALTPYWSARLGKTSLTAYQASSRGGFLRVRLEGNRVFIAGQALTLQPAIA